MATALVLLCGAKTIVSAANQPAGVRLSVSPVELQICNCLIVTNSQVTLEADVSDADGQVTRVVFYLRFNMPTGAITFTTPALMPNPIAPTAPFVRTNLFAYIYDVAFFERTLRPGRNVLAVELHQGAPPDPSARFDLWLKTFTADSRCCPGFRSISAKATDGKVVLEFGGTLMTAEDVRGPYEPLPSAASPAAVVPEGKARFYRAE